MAADSAVYKWNMVREEKKYIKLELPVIKRAQEQYEREQKEYVHSLREANKYSKLIFLGDSIISGYLYQKFSEIESTGVAIRYKIKGSLAKHVIPAYELVELISILIDNAMEVQSGTAEKKQLLFLLEEQEKQCWFRICIPHPYASYDEIESWFLPKSRKNGEKLGLYDIKSLCADYHMDLLCKNTLYEDENWIEFAVGIKKADKP